MSTNDVNHNRTAPCVKPAKMTIDDLLAEKMQRDQQRAEVIYLLVV